MTWAELLRRAGQFCNERPLLNRAEFIAAVERFAESMDIERA